jgi:hypothetical protein
MHCTQDVVSLIIASGTRGSVFGKMSNVQSLVLFTQTPRCRVLQQRLACVIKAGALQLVTLAAHSKELSCELANLNSSQLHAQRLL